MRAGPGGVGVLIRAFLVLPGLGSYGGEFPGEQRGLRNTEGEYRFRNVLSRLFQARIPPRNLPLSPWKWGRQVSGQKLIFFRRGNSYNVIIGQ